MGYICKDVCRQQHSPQIFVNNSKTNKIGIDVYYCRACNIFVKFKEILTNFINTIFHQTLKKLRCGCCGSKLRVKLRPKRLRDKREYKKCKCGCGELIKIIGKRGTPVEYKKNHHTRNPDIKNRRCIFCYSNKTALNKNENKTPKWFKFKNLGFICKRCYAKHQYRLKKTQKKSLSVVPLLIP